MTKPSISVLTCCFNAGDFLREAIESVLNQSWKDFEFLLVDDGSTDSTPQLLRTYAAQDSRITVLTKPNTGLADSLNSGLQRARAPWIARLDADDVALSERLEHQLDFVRRQPKVILLGSGCWEIDAQGRRVKQHSYPSGHFLLLKSLERIRPCFPHSSALFSRRHALQVGGYRTRFARSQDRDLWLRLAGLGIMACLPHPLVLLRKHPAAISNSDQGRLQQMMGIAASVCHLLRRSHLPDPADSSPEEWSQFLCWMERRLDEENYFRGFETLQSLRNAWYTNSDAGWTTRARRFWEQCREHPDSMGVLLERIYGYGIAGKLARSVPSFSPTTGPYARAGV